MKTPRYVSVRADANKSVRCDDGGKERRKTKTRKTMLGVKKKEVGIGGRKNKSAWERRGTRVESSEIICARDCL